MKRLSLVTICLASTLLSGCQFALIEKQGAGQLTQAHNAATDGNYDGAEAAYKGAIANATDARVKGEALYGLARIYRGSEKAASQGNSYFQLLTQASDIDYDPATHKLAELYESGGEISRDYGKAAELYESIADRYPRSRIALARLNQRQSLTSNNVSQAELRKAMSEYRAQATAGDTGAMILLAHLYRDGEIVTKNLDTAETWYRKAIAAGDAKASSELAWLWLTEKKRANHPGDAVSLLEDAANLGDFEAMKDLGKLYEHGLEDGTRIVDISKAGSWYAKAAQKGHVGSMEAYGKMLLDEYYVATGIARRDPATPAALIYTGRRGSNITAKKRKVLDTSISWLKRAKSQNSTGATSTLARIYKSGARGTRPALAAESFKLLTEAYKTSPAKIAYELADSYDRGIGTRANPAKAAELYKLAAHNGNTSAYGKLGRMYLNGRGVARNPNLAREYLEKSGDANSIGTLTALGDIYNRGIGTKRNVTLAVDYYTKAANQGHVGSIKKLADIYTNKGSGVYNASQAFKWNLKAAELGQQSAYMRVADAYSYGRGVAKNPRKADIWMQKALKNNPGKLLSIAKSYEYGRGVPKSASKAFQLYKQAANYGNKNAYFPVATAYAEGNGTAKNAEEAVKWYKKAANSGNVRAANILAKSYSSGFSGKVDMKEAIKWYEKAALAGDTKAYMNIANAYAVGLGVKQSMATSYTWYEKAANAGNAEAQYKLGLGYARGTGVAKDLKLATKWLQKAEKNGYPAAQVILDSLK